MITGKFNVCVLVPENRMVTLVIDGEMQKKINI